MLVDFKELPDHSRIWIYQANRSFTDAELEEISADLSLFLQQWTAHGSQLKAGFEIRYKRFLVIGLDQSAASASGCSIDASVHFIQQLEKKYGVDPPLSVKSILPSTNPLQLISVIFSVDV